MIVRRRLCFQAKNIFAMKYEKNVTNCVASEMKSNYRILLIFNWLNMIWILKPNFHVCFMKQSKERKLRI